MSERRPSKWELTVAANPDHSRWYTERFRQMAAQGADLGGEARLVDAMAPRAARILDAGCGPGRVAGELHRRGHHLVGIDVDPYLIEAATTDYPGPTYLVGDIAELDPADPAMAAGFDVIVCAGNVMPFLAPGSHLDALRCFAAVLRPQGRAVIGFGAGRGYEFDQFAADAVTGGLRMESQFSTWDLRPFDHSSGFLVAVLGLAS